MSFPLTMPALVYLSGNKLISLSPPDILIIVLYFLAVLGIGFYLRSFAGTSEGLFHGRPRYDGMGSRPELSVCESWRAGADGMGRRCLPVRNSRCPLLFGWLSPPWSSSAWS